MPRVFAAPSLNLLQLRQCEVNGYSRVNTERQTGDDAVKRVCEFAELVSGGSNEHTSLSVERGQLTTFTTIEL